MIEVLREKSPQQISELMSISDKLAVLNVGRYEAFSPRFTAKNSRQAVLAFNGDVYEGLDAHSLKPRELDWAQDHVVILSGLYGALRPLDLLQPYRLEMGTRLHNAKGSNLYQFWGSQIADYLNQRSDEQPEAERIVVNLASQEYFKSVDLKTLKAPWWSACLKTSRAANTRSSASTPSAHGALWCAGPCSTRRRRWPICASSISKAMHWPSRPARPPDWCSAASCKTDPAH